MSNLKAQVPAFNFVIHPTASSFDVPYETYASQHASSKFAYTIVATGSIVFDSSTPPKVLLIQRAASDSMPNLWETPGGGCDVEDPSILYSAARELWEEAGLVASTVGPRIGDDHLFLTRSGRLVCKFYFLVEAERDESGNLAVKLDLNEHQSFVWASEKEVIEGRIGNIEVVFTTAEQKAAVVEAFKTRKDAVKS